MKLRVPGRLGHYLEEAEDGPVLSLCPLPSGTPTVLTGSGVVIWLSATAGDEDIPASVADAFDVDVKTIRAEVEGFLDYLIDAGFLEPVP